MRTKLRSSRILSLAIIFLTFSVAGEAPSREMILEAQELLAQQGRYSGPVDGKMGPRTEQSIRQYQEQAGLRVDGLITDDLMRSLRTAIDLSRLHLPDGRREWLTNNLRAVASMQEVDAKKTVDTLRVARSKALDTGKHAAGLLVAVALEHAGNLNAAREEYRELENEAKATPYAASANFRLRTMELAKGELEVILEQIAQEPEVEGWFLVSNRWTWSTARRAALQGLVELRANHLSFRLFTFLHSLSTFPAAYAYLFVLLALAGGIKVLELPLLGRVAKFVVLVRRFSGEIQQIQQLYGNDPVTMQQALLEFYRERKMNPFSGCAVIFVDLVFVIWALFTLADFTPQLRLDGATFLWVPDISRYDGDVLIMWVIVLCVVQWLTATGAQQSGQRGLLFIGSVFSAAIFGGIAWYWEWPTFLLIFWGLLAILSFLINIVLRVTWTILT